MRASLRSPKVLAGASVLSCAFASLVFSVRLPTITSDFPLLSCHQLSVCLLFTGPHATGLLYQGLLPCCSRALIERSNYVPSPRAQNTLLVLLQKPRDPPLSR